MQRDGRKPPVEQRPDDKRKAKQDAPVRDCREAPAPNPNGGEGTPAVDAKPVDPPPT
jgi:hypothetical protein